MSTKKNRLIKKSIVSQDNYTELFDAVDIYPIFDPEFRVMLKQKFEGYYTNGHVKLTKMGVAHDKCWFINSGMVMGKMRINSRKTIPLLFKQGQFAILPDSFFYNQLPNCYFVACPDTHLLQMSLEDAKEVFEEFPKAKDLSLMIAAFHSRSLVDQAAIVGLPAKERVIELHRIYKDIVGPNRKVKLQDTHQANFLGMTKGTFSKLLKQIYGPTPES